MGHRIQIRGKKTDEKKSCPGNSWRFIFFVGLLGFLLVTLLGSHMIESQLEKDISADLYQSAYRISENEDIRYNISASSLDSIREKTHYGCRLSQYHHLDH